MKLVNDDHIGRFLQVELIVVNGSTLKNHIAFILFCIL